MSQEPRPAEAHELAPLATLFAVLGSGWTASDLAAAQRRCLVIHSGDGEPEAGLCLELLPDDAEIQLLVVRPGARRAGLGARLVTAAIELARGAGRSCLILELRADNGAALALYRRCGFEEEGRRPRYYPDGTDALLLRRDLGRGAT
ncbi:MAG: GNAT family N-acetyltransferase [Acidobacteriota bacterium]